MRSDVCEFPGEGTGLTVREDDCRANFVEQCGVAGVVVDCLQRCVVLCRHLRSIQSIEDRVAGEAGAGPLRVQIGLGVGREGFGGGELLFVGFD